MHKLIPIDSMPLEGDLVVSESLTIRVARHRTTVSLQTAHRASTPIEAVTLRGVHLPSCPNMTAGNDPLIWWVGPEYWLAVSEELCASEIIAELATATEGHLAVIVDVSDSLRAIQLLGDAAPEVIARGTSLRFDERVLEPGRCARTRFANLAVLLRPLQQDGYEFLVDRSEAQFLLDWLQDSAASIDSNPSDTKDVALGAGNVNVSSRANVCLASSERSDAG